MDLKKKVPLAHLTGAIRLALALILLAHLVEMNPEVQNSEKEHSDGPSLIDWKTYTSAFNKKYSSLTQQLVRQKLFMSKTIQVFLSAAKYRVDKLSYYMAINQYSDLTPEEERAKMSGDSGGYATDDEDGMDDEDLMDDVEIKRALLEELENQDKISGTNLRQLYDKKKPTGKLAALAQAKRRPKRSTPEREMEEEASKSLSFDDLVRLPGQEGGSEKSALNIKWVVPSDNPDYVPVEQISMGTDMGPCKTGEKVEDIPEDQIKEIEKSASVWTSLQVPKVFGAIGSYAKSTYSWIMSKSFNGRHENEPSRRMGTSGKNGNKESNEAPVQNIVIKDWRETGCIAPPIEQGNCQSCYAVTSTSFLEWAFCMSQDRVLTPLSAQYMVSCGPQFKSESEHEMKFPLEFHGCGCGRSRHAMYFVREYGAELEANMPYLGVDTPCPVEPGTPPRHKGYLRPNVKQHIRMAGKTTQLELALKVGPVIVNFWEPVDFLAYGGGMVGTCYQRGGHAMLVVGHGVENNKPYLIIKNSFGTQWGIKGYFKFDREHTSECIKDFILPRVSFPSKKSQARRAKAYLAEHDASKESNSEKTLADLDKIFDVGAGGLFS